MREIHCSTRDGGNCGDDRNFEKFCFVTLAAILVLGSFAILCNTVSKIMVSDRTIRHVVVLESSIVPGGDNNIVIELKPSAAGDVADVRPEPPVSEGE